MFRIHTIKDKIWENRITLLLDMQKNNILLPKMIYSLEYISRVTIFETLLIQFSFYKFYFLIYFSYLLFRRRNNKLTKKRARKQTIFNLTWLKGKYFRKLIALNRDKILNYEVSQISSYSFHEVHIFKFIISCLMKV